MVDTVRTLSALQSLLADNSAGDISAQDVRDFLVSVWREAGEQTLTNETPSGTGAFEQWGTEELTFTGYSGFTVVVEALAIGYISLQGVDDETFDTKVQVSVDGGSTWSDGNSVTVTVTVGNARMRIPMTSGAVKTEACTGDIQIRGMVEASSLTNNPTWAGGLVMGAVSLAPTP